MSIKMTDSRRLTGPNLLMPNAGAILDAECPNEHREIIANLWKDVLTDILKHLNRNSESITFRLFDGGINLAFSEAVDCLYSATEINELAFTIACRRFEGEKDITITDQLETIQKHLLEEKKPKLIKLIQIANAKNIPFLTDDEIFSLGYGNHSKQWPIDEIPHPDEISWHKYRDIPVFMITGSNGKSTTVRLLCSILNIAGYKTGMTSTDFIRVGDTIIDHGDYSGPGGARTILRHPSADAAVLEIARGGILRRGLPCNNAIACAVTNVAEDHLGDYGITTITEMAETKLTVRKGLKENGLLVVNADDETLMKTINILEYPSICYFSLTKQHVDHQVYLDSSNIYYQKNDLTELICNVTDIPIALNGAARHNVANAMTAIALAKANHIAVDLIKKGLSSFKGDLYDNPGRGNYFNIGGATVLVDFAHNEHGMRAIVDTVNQIDATRRLLLIGQAGDRSDEDIQALAVQAAGIKPDYIIITEIPVYLRGRKEGEVPNLFENEFRKLGFKENQILKTGDSLSGVKAAMNWSNSGDMLVLFALSQRNEVFHYLRDLQK